MPTDARHRKLVDKIADIFGVSGFETDRLVHVAFSGRETDLDVCALYQDALIIIECKSGRRLEFHNLIDELRIKRDGFVRALEERKLIVKGSEDRKATMDRLGRASKFKMVLILSNHLPDDSGLQYAAATGIGVLDRDAIEYYQRISQVLKTWTRFEIFREMEIEAYEGEKSIHRPSVRIRQPNGEFYIFSLQPWELLRIAYVFRRSLQETYAYQRMVSQARIERIGEFLGDPLAFLPNSILIAFDKDVKDSVKFESNKDDSDDGFITFPLKYCSAWIIDGQHRLYGFTRTIFANPPPETPAPHSEFQLLVVGIKGFDREQQARTFVDINENQKKINPTLLLDLTTLIKDLRNPLTWPSLLVKALNKQDPWKDRIRILEVERDKPITMAGFAKYALAGELLKRKRMQNRVDYTGPLFNRIPFDNTLPFNDPTNNAAFQKQVQLLVRFFKALRSVIGEDKWINSSVYGLTKTSGVNASLLVLSRILEARADLSFDLELYLRPLRDLSFENEWIIQFGLGWEGFKRLANRMILALNKKDAILHLRRF